MCIIVGIKRGCCRDQLSVCMRQHMPPATAIHVQARLALLLLRYAPNCLRTCWFVPPALYLNVSKSEDPTHPVRASASPYEYPGGTSEQPRSRRDSDPRPLPKTLAPIREMREDMSGVPGLRLAKRSNVCNKTTTCRHSGGLALGQAEAATYQGPTRQGVAFARVDPLPRFLGFIAL